MSRSALALKEEGNRHFQVKDYAGAEALYSKAIVADPKNPKLYTNRAMARLNMSLWENVIADCQECLKLAPETMKAHYYISQAALNLHDFGFALEHAFTAHKLCVSAGDKDKSMAHVTAQVLKCKKEQWDDRERRRKRETTELESEVLSLMERERNEAVGDMMDVNDGSRHEIEADWQHKIDALRDVFEKARSGNEKRRKVPDWAVDDISFGFMVDPVVTKTGKSYERGSLMEHLRRHPTDPLTREPLYMSELRPNINLKDACKEFLDENGWAADW
ncbi:U-box domain-containing protein [Bombardia bombarda]|uniref:U-box domain-containing protein n=1 Tax=Bombardia bombarda TaxID=252184 RepID=A0AA39XLZ9_9PEZI|nr:U-box domain-containing protein [Bombardia bombarda]